VKKVEVPSRVARALKLADEEELEAEMPVKAVVEPTPLVPVPAEESDVQVIKAPLVKKRKLNKAVEPTVRVTEPSASVIKPATRVIETATPMAKAVNMVGFLAARRKQAPPPSVPRMADVEAFLANEPVLAVLVKVLEMAAEKPLQAPGGPHPFHFKPSLGLKHSTYPRGYRHGFEGIRGDGRRQHCAIWFCSCEDPPRGIYLQFRRWGLLLKL
jgi:hypothetical protein